MGDVNMNDDNLKGELKGAQRAYSDALEIELSAKVNLDNVLAQEFGNWRVFDNQKFNQILPGLHNRAYELSLDFGIPSKEHQTKLAANHLVEVSLEYLRCRGGPMFLTRVVLERIFANQDDAALLNYCLGLGD